MVAVSFRVEQDPQRRLNVRRFQQAVRGKVAPEFSIPQAVTFAPDSCASLQWTDGTLHLYGLNINLSMWISALGVRAMPTLRHTRATQAGRAVPSVCVCVCVFVCVCVCVRPSVRSCP